MRTLPANLGADGNDEHSWNIRDPEKYADPYAHEN